MRKVYFLFLIVCCFFKTSAQEVRWPHHKKAAIVLTYDDALPSQLNNAVPALKKAGLKATFFLTGDIDSISIPRWRKLGKSGFELGNHTIYHPCAATDDTPTKSEPYTAYRIIREIQTMDRLLFAVDGKTKRTFAYPCTETFVGGKDYLDSLRRWHLIKYARGGGDSTDMVTDFVRLDSLNVPSYGLEGGESGKQIIAFVKKVTDKGGLGVIMLHGVGGDYISISTEAHQELLSYLRSHRHEVWVATFQQALDEVYRQVKKPRPTSIAGD